MSEIAIDKKTGKRVKIGCCDNLYYLRFEQRADVRALPGNVDPVRQSSELWYRLPLPEEEGTAPGAFEYSGPCGARPLPIFVPETVTGPDGKEAENPTWTKLRADLETRKSGIIQLKTGNGVLVNVPCFHGVCKDLPQGMFYNGHHSQQLAAFAVGVAPSGVPAVLVGCRFCGRSLFGYELPEFRDTFAAQYYEDEPRFSYLVAKLEEYAADIRAGH